jgi:hypothetical protein
MKEETNITAVSWLVAELITCYNLRISLDGLVALSNEALAREKAQSMYDFEEGVYVGVTGIDRDAEDYYNITYGK